MRDGLWIADYSHPAGQHAIQRPWLFHQYSQDQASQCCRETPVNS